MKYKKVKLISVLLLVLGLTGLQAQTMYVKESSGTQTAYVLSDIRKMSLSSGNLTVTKTDNSNSVYALSGLRYLNFANVPFDIKEYGTNELEGLATYPNPVKDFLYIDFSGTAKQSGTINILNLEGLVLKAEQVSIEGTVSMDLSQLPQGVYLCRYSNGTEIKTVKIIKQ